MSLLLEVLMLAFIFTYSWTGAKDTDHHADGKLVISAAPVEQIVFRDSDSSTKTLLPTLSKSAPDDSELNRNIIDLASIEVLTCDALLIVASLYNTFYTTTTIGAP